MSRLITNKHSSNVESENMSGLVPQHKPSSSLYYEFKFEIEMNNVKEPFHLRPSKSILQKEFSIKISKQLALLDFIKTVMIKISCIPAEINRVDNMATYKNDT